MKIIVAKKTSNIKKSINYIERKNKQNVRIEMDDTLEEQIKKEKMTNLLKKLLLYITI